MDKNLYQRLKRYTPKENWALSLDHIPILIQLDLDIKIQPNSKRYVIRKFNINSLLVKPYCMCPHRHRWKHYWEIVPYKG